MFLPAYCFKTKTQHFLLHTLTINYVILIKETIKDYGIDENDFLARLDDMVEQAFDDQCTGAPVLTPVILL